MPQTYALKHPITLTIKGPTGERSEVITALELNFPADGIMRAKHLREMDGHSGLTAMTLALIGLFSGQPVRVLEELAEPDFLELYEMVSDFRKPGQSTGETA